MHHSSLTFYLEVASIDYLSFIYLRYVLFFIVKYFIKDLMLKISSWHDLRQKRYNRLLYNFVVLVDFSVILLKILYNKVQVKLCFKTLVLI